MFVFLLEAGVVFRFRETDVGVLVFFFFLCFGSEQIPALGIYLFLGLVADWVCTIY